MAGIGLRELGFGRRSVARRSRGTRSLGGRVEPGPAGSVSQISPPPQQLAATQVLNLLRIWTQGACVHLMRALSMRVERVDEVDRAVVQSVEAFVGVPLFGARPTSSCGQTLADQCWAPSQFVSNPSDPRVRVKALSPLPPPSCESILGDVRGRARLGVESECLTSVVQVEADAGSPGADGLSERRGLLTSASPPKAELEGVVSGANSEPSGGSFTFGRMSERART